MGSFHFREVNEAITLECSPDRVPHFCLEYANPFCGPCVLLLEFSKDEPYFTLRKGSFSVEQYEVGKGSLDTLVSAAVSLGRRVVRKHPKLFSEDCPGVSLGTGHPFYEDKVAAVATRAGIHPGEGRDKNG